MMEWTTGECGTASIWHMRMKCACGESGSRVLIHCDINLEFGLN